MIIRFHSVKINDFFIHRCPQMITQICADCILKLHYVFYCTYCTYCVEKKSLEHSISISEPNTAFIFHLVTRHSSLFSATSPHENIFNHQCVN